ncbi:MAG: DMT family transporter [Candidatus Cloacimonetes bacterium]|nr:DMT family transporter [Candidatus Cloacimonadota bacterium]
MKHRPKAVIFMLISALAFAIMASFVKLAGDIPIFEKVFVRNFISFAVALIVIVKSKTRLFGEKENRKYLILRSLLGLTGVILYFYAINNLYLADSSMLNKISPFFVTLFAWIFLMEKLSKIRSAALIVIFISALLIIKPRFDLSIIPALSGFLSAMFAGAAYTVVRFLGKRENPETIVFYFSLVSVLVMFPLMMMNFQKPDPVQLLYLFGTGIFAAVGQFGLTLAYKFEKASKIAVYNYTNIVFSVILGFMLWGEIPDIWSIIGGLILIAVSVGIYIFN